MEKELLRQKIIACIAALDQDKLKAEDDIITKRIIESEIWQRAKSIFCYVSINEEINTYPLLVHALGSGKCLAVPYIVETGMMEAKQIEDLRQLKPDRFGIPAPPSSSLLIAPDRLDLIIVPGVAYEKKSLLRLGRGGGYYDRFLTQSSAYRLAPARTCQLVEPGQIASNEHDMMMDMIITAKDIWIKG